MSTKTHLSASWRTVKGRFVNALTSAFEYYVIRKNNGGGERDRTDDPLLAKQVLSQLSYTPIVRTVVGLDGFEPSTPALSRRCSNQLSYRPPDAKPARVRSTN